MMTDPVHWPLLAESTPEREKERKRERERESVRERWRERNSDFMQNEGPAGPLTPVSRIYT
jgi:hypothetical protein